MHRAIKLHYKDNICLYISNILGCLFPSLLWPNKKKFQKMYMLTKKKLNKELNIIKLIKNLRNQKILAKNSLLTNEVKAQINHQEKNLLNLEDTSDFDSNDPSSEESEVVNPEEIILDGAQNTTNFGDSNNSIINTE